jgi:TfoX/Sxy family transcriptional regulator of competence genes
MAYNEKLAERIEKYLNAKKLSFHSKKMMGGLCFMVNDKMCVGVEKDRIMARVGPDNYEIALQRKGAKEMDFTGKVMRGFVFVDSKVLSSAKELSYWLELCLEYNPKAKSSKKSGKKPELKNSPENVSETLKKIILKYDKLVKQGTGGVMGNTNGFVFTQEGVFKYGVNKTKAGYSFHSMAMYANPDLFNDLKSRMTKAKFQKGCVNFKSLDDFPVELFEEHMKKSAKCDFSMVINHYKNKKK